MRQTAEFRINERFATMLFTKNEGKRLSDLVRKIEVETTDPRFRDIGRLQQKLLAKNDELFFYYWHFTRTYSIKELQEAKLFHFMTTAFFEPCGEQCETIYDESTACQKCGAGATQISDLHLDFRKIPKNKHIASTIANEIIVSQWLAEKMTDSGLTGFELQSVKHKAKYEDDPIDLKQWPAGREILQKAQAAGAPHPGWEFWVWLNRRENNKLVEQVHAEYAAAKGQKERRNNKPLPVWYQLIIRSADAQIVSPTRLGIDPFDDDKKGEYRCSKGDLIGLNLLSEVSIKAESRGNADIVSSRQFVGTRRGLLRPRRVILISPKFWKLLESEKIKGVNIEIAHLV